jgi:hypothetical protein
MPYLSGLPLPEPHVDYEEFWQGCRDNRLVIQRCDDCGRYRHHPRPLCPKCRSWNAKWTKISGKGEVWSYTIITHPIDLAVEDKTPYNIVEIELLEQEGLRMISNLIDCKNEEIYIGMPVIVVFEEISPEITLPRFKKASF